MKPTPPGRQEAGDVDNRSLRRLSWSFLAACLLVGVASLASQACQPRERPALTSSSRPAPAPAPVEAPVVQPEAFAVVEAPQRRQLPPLQGEPTVRVLLERRELVALRFLRSAQGPGLQLEPGAKAVRSDGQSFVITGLPRPVAGPELVLRFQPGAGPSFTLPGPGNAVRPFAGDLVLRIDAGRIAVIEDLPMESYLHGVIQKEVEPDWPLEALKAQAVAARSYATAMWMERHASPWQLDASEQVDMAYACFVEKPHVRLSTAVDQTRGNLLWFADQPLPAYFHAASGGYVEDIRHVWPQRTCPDGITAPGPAMPSRPDPWALRGERVAPQRLGAWSFRITYQELGEKLAARKLDFGQVHRIRVVEQDPVSGRARSVDITGSRLTGRISAHALRMACGSTRVKSTLWTSFRFSDTALVIEGRGYGHGIGLPQASAWAMAQGGELASTILRQYYSGASLVKKW
jgi:stage II sporulation protein D